MDGFSLTTIKEVVQVLGINGLVLILWYIDHRRLDRQYNEHREEIAKQHLAHIAAQSEHEKAISEILSKYKTDIETIKAFYCNNVDLVRNYEKLSEELMQVIRLTIQVQTQLVDSIKNNMFCPVLRDNGPNRG